MITNNKVPNRLINEKSPYLLQHAHNPVNWYPWGREAFETAKNENKPIFLSIGYSTCHWCHVMERESFEDIETAEILNKNFISIKVDREERPDIDHIYMDVCQALTGQGGWPLSIFMAHDAKPFFAGTYFPKENYMGISSFKNILITINRLWKSQNEKLIIPSLDIEDILNRQNQLHSEEFKEELLHQAFYSFKSSFDKTYGGFGTAPKFPTPHNLLFLLRYWYVYKQDLALKMVEKTLDSMYKGGIYDHIGFGFSRYSTDSKWLIPHFEKMLYDNALISIAYLETYQATKNKKYANVASEIFKYVLRDMKSADGGFFSAEDADSEGVEGKFYVWSVKEIHDVLGHELAEKFCKYYNITNEGNFEGLNIPNLINSDISENDLALLENCRKELFLAREKRIHPFKDDKILTSWNGLMISAMAIGGKVLGDTNLIAEVENAVKFIFSNLVRNDGRLLARYRNGESAHLAYLDDYAFLTLGLIELYQSTFNPYYLKKALTLIDDTFKYFGDDNNGLFLYGNDAEKLISRPKEIYDGATPSGNSVTAYNLIRLSRLTRDTSLEEKAKQIMNSFSSSIANFPLGHSFSLCNLLFLNSSPKEVVILGNNTETMISSLHKNFHPFTTYNIKSKEVEEILPFIKDYTSLDSKPTAYICKDFSCMPPITDIEEFNKYLI